MEGSLNLPEQAILDLFLARRSNIGFAAIGPEESATRRIAVRARHILGVSSANRKLSRNGVLGHPQAGHLSHLKGGLTSSACPACLGSRIRLSLVPPKINSQNRSLGR